jgi:hypothetical protein
MQMHWACAQYKKIFKLRHAQDCYKKMVNWPRKLNFFELVLLLVGIGVGIVGFLIINNLYQDDPTITWDLYQTVFLWLLLIVMLILAATMEDVKEELAIVIREHIEETKILRDINKGLLTETKLMREELGKRLRK